MKRYLYLFMICLLLIGCGNKSEKDVLKNIKKKTENLNSYIMQGELKIYNGDNKYTYNVEVNYKKDDLYKVSLINTVNDHEQIILRNKEGVYVLTPSLNKSFKFQSDWPYNNSQIYIIERIMTDIESDNSKIYEHKNSKHIFTTKVNYSTNTDLESQKVYFDKNYKLKKVEVYTKNKDIAMEFSVKKLDDNKKIKDSVFDLKNNLDEEVSKEVAETINNVVYPMYLPVNTYLTSQDKVIKEDGERIILTFGGDKSFTLIEETITVGKDLDVNITYGEPDIILDTVGVIDDNSISWVSNEIEYSLVSDNLDKEELISVAKSISSASLTK